MDIFRKSFIFGKLNCEPPKDYNEENENQPYYDPKGKYGGPILGGLNNGYSFDELNDFFEKMKGYASYLFNLSHSAAYAVITLCTMYLKKKYPAKYFAALLSMQSKEEKIDLYSKTAKKYGIKINVPDINYSDYDFIEKDGSILYGLKGIKGVGDTSIPDIIANRPYTSLNDYLEKATSKSKNKTVVTNLIKAGAFDSFNTNRYELINELLDNRKAKDDRLIANNYNKDTCIKLETEVLGTSITHELWWDIIQNGDLIEQTFTLVKNFEKYDKKNKLMAMPTLSIEGVNINCIVFASLYCKCMQAFDTNLTNTITIQGKKDGNKIIINKVLAVNE